MISIRFALNPRFARISNLFIVSIMLIAFVGVLQAAAAPETSWVVVERLAAGAGVGPEDIAFDAEGRVYASMGDGKVMRFQPDGSQPEVFAETPTRPLGLRFDAEGNLIVCDGQLFSIAPDGTVTMLSDEAEGVPLNLANGLDIAADGTIYFTDSSIQFPRAEIMKEFTQPGPYGRLLAYEPATKTTRLVLDNLWFANGVIVSPDQSFLLVAEATAARVTRYWLTGPKQGESDVFMANVVVDNLATNGKDLFRIPLYFDGVLLEVDMDGNVVRKLNLRHPSGEPYAGFTGAREHQGMLYLSNNQADAIGRLLPYSPSGPADFTNVFFITLAPGLNLVSLPLEPITPYSARSLAEKLSATVVIELDDGRQRFVGFTPDAPDDGFQIEGGKGYIVNVPEGGTFAFVGAVWTNEPPVEAAPPTTQSDSAWAFVVSGRLDDVEQVANLFHVTVRNTRTNAVATGIVRSGYFAAAFADLNRKNVVQTGDRLEFQVRNQAGEIVSETFTYRKTKSSVSEANTVTAEAILKASLPITLKEIGKSRHSMWNISTKTGLLQNYPNPFNPETWLPYHLAQDANVTISIYNLKGQLIRTLFLGNQSVGVYVMKHQAAYWDGRNSLGQQVASGLYFYTLHAGDFRATRKMVILK